MGENLKDLLIEIAALVDRAETCALREALQVRGVERQVALNSHTVLAYMHANVEGLINPPRLEDKLEGAMQEQSFYNRGLRR